MIRRARVEDAASLAEIAARTFIDTFAAQNKPEDMNAFVARTYGEEHQRRELQDPELTTLLVESGDAMIGFAQLRRGEAPACVEAESHVEIQRFYVDRTWQGRGVAQTLMRECERLANELGVHAIWLGVWEHNTRARRFYEKCGFRDVGSHPFLLGSDLQTDRVMVRDLA